MVLGAGLADAKPAYLHLALQLSIIYEPEAAALHVAGADTTPSSPSPSPSSSSSLPPASRRPAIAPGDVFMVVDAGGGTVDITVHKVMAAAAAAAGGNEWVGGGGGLQPPSKNSPRPLRYG